MITRRQFLQAAGLAGAAAATGAWRIPLAGAATSTATRVPPPDQSGIEHIVVVMMENRSFDHFMGWLPGADGRQSGLSYQDSSGRRYSTHSLSGQEYMGCAHPDPGHSYEQGRVQYNGGKMDGFLLDGSGNDVFAAGYYGAADRPFMSQLALHYTTLDRYFCSILAETFPNRFFLHAATTDRRHNDGTTSTSIYPTIWDRLQAKGVSHKYYFSDVPFLGLWGTRYLSISAPYAQFLADAAGGTLPAVSYVDPRFEDEGTGTSGDDHPHADIRAGDNFLAEIYRAVTLGPGWGKTVLIVTYDEWGGFFDHVPPPRAAASALEDIGNPGHNVEDPDQVVNGKALLGFRVPCIVASPFTMGRPASPRVYGTPTRQKAPFDHTSILKLIEWRHGLLPLTARDASNDVGNLLDVFDFQRPDASAPVLPLPPPPLPNACVGSSSLTPEDSAWAQLRTSDLLTGWSLP